MKRAPSIAYSSIAAGWTEGTNWPFPALIILIGALDESPASSLALAIAASNPPISSTRPFPNAWRPVPPHPPPKYHPGPKD